MLFSGIADVVADVFDRCQKRKEPTAIATRIKIAPKMFLRLICDCLYGRHGRLYSRALEFLRHFRIADVVGVEIEGVDADAVFHFTLSEIVQIRLPLRHIAPDLRRHVWKAKCARHRRNPLSAARC